MEGSTLQSEVRDERRKALFDLYDPMHKLPGSMCPRLMKCQNWGIYADAWPRDIRPQRHLGSEVRDERWKAFFELYDPMGKEPRVSMETFCCQRSPLGKCWEVLKI